MASVGPLGPLASITLNALNFPLTANTALRRSVPQTLGPLLGQRVAGVGALPLLSPFPFFLTLLRAPISAPPGPPLLPFPVAPVPAPDTHPLLALPSARPSGRPSGRPSAPRLLLPGLVSNLRASPGSAPGHVR